MVAFKLLAAVLVAGTATAQTFRRSAACPKLGCVYPPDQVDFIAGQTFDIRVEVQAPVNGSEAYNNGVPSPDFTLQIGSKGSKLQDVTKFFGIKADAEVESYNFTYFEDLFAKEEGAATPVNVLAKSYRNIQLHQPGEYHVVFTYNNGMQTTATWTVLPLPKKPKAKNIIFFLGDGMAGSMVSAARLLAHKTINGKYQTMLKMDEAEAFGLQMTHSLDSFITDSANSASALFTGKKMTVNGLNMYTSTGNAFGSPKVETVFEMARRTLGMQIGVVSKAYIADASPAAVCTHTSQRSQYTAIIEQYLTGVSGNYSWFPWQGVDLLFGGGAENFLPGPGNGNVSQFDRWAEHGYQVGFNNTQLQAFDNAQRALGIFTRGNLSTWLDKNVYPDTLANAIQPDGTQGAYDQPGLKEMTLKAVDMLSTRAKKRKTGWALFSEAALIDKEMHVQDTQRALGDLLELDDTIRATLEHLKKIGELDNTLIVVTADHGHGFDVFGSADTKYLAKQTTDRKKRDAIGAYINSGLSDYVVPDDVMATNHTVFTGEQGSGFPVTWDPRYAIAHGWAAFPDKREDFRTATKHERIPATKNAEAGSGYFFNPDDKPDGFGMTGNMDGTEAQGVHSLVDVPIYAWGPGAELFRGVHSNVDIAFNVAAALGLGRNKNVTTTYQK